MPRLPKRIATAHVERGGGELTFTAFDTVVAVRADDGTARREAETRLRWLGWRPTACGDADVSYEVVRSGGAWQLRCDGTCVSAFDRLEDTVDAFENHAKILTATRAQGRLFVHAGAVSSRGRGIVIPGRSRSGKTTLVAALIAAGAELCSDEFAVLDADGSLHPFPLPLSIRSTASRPAGRFTAASLGARAADTPVPVSLIIVTEYRPGGRWRPRPLSPGHALLALMNNTVAARQSPQVAMAVLRQAVDHAAAIASVRGEARRAAAAILAYVDQRR